MKTKIIVNLIGILSIPILSFAQNNHAQPILRDGGCPSGFYVSGNYCTPGSNAHNAIAKSGSCPSGYFPSGNYCVALSENSKPAIPKHGSCPSGYYPSSDYCVAYK